MAGLEGTQEPLTNRIDIANNGTKFGESKTSPAAFDDENTTTQPEQNPLTFQDVKAVILDAIAESGASSQVTDTEVSSITYAAMDAINHTPSPDAAMVPMQALENTIISALHNEAQDSGAFSDATTNVYLANEVLSLILQGASGSVSGLATMQDSYGDATPQGQEKRRKEAAIASFVNNQIIQSSIAQQIGITPEEEDRINTSIYGAIAKSAGVNSDTLEEGEEVTSDRIQAHIDMLREASETSASWNFISSTLIEQGQEELLTNLEKKLIEYVQEHQDSGLTQQALMDEFASEVLQTVVARINSDASNDITKVIQDVDNATGPEILTALITGLTPEDENGSFQEQQLDLEERMKILSLSTGLAEILIGQNPENQEYASQLAQLKDLENQTQARQALYTAVAEEYEQMFGSREAPPSNEELTALVGDLYNKTSIRSAYNQAGLGILDEDELNDIINALAEARQANESATLNMQEKTTTVISFGNLFQQLQGDGITPPTQEQMQEFLSDISGTLASIKSDLNSNTTDLEKEQAELRKRIESLEHFAQLEGTSNFTSAITEINAEIDALQETITYNNATVELTEAISDFIQNPENLECVAGITSPSEMIGIALSEPGLKEAMMTMMETFSDDQRKQFTLDAAEQFGIPQDKALSLFEQQNSFLGLAFDLNDVQKAATSVWDTVSSFVWGEDETEVEAETNSDFTTQQREILTPLIANRDAIADQLDTTCFVEPLQSYYTEELASLNEQITTIENRLAEYEAASERAADAENRLNTIAAQQADMYPDGVGMHSDSFMNSGGFSFMPTTEDRMNYAYDEMKAAESQMDAIEASINGDGGDNSGTTTTETEAPAPAPDEAQLALDNNRAEIVALFTEAHPGGLRQESAALALKSMGIPETEIETVLQLAEQQIPEANIITADNTNAAPGQNTAPSIAVVPNDSKNTLASTPDRPLHANNLNESSIMTMKV